jgi:hypothetical protein
MTPHVALILAIGKRVNMAPDMRFHWECSHAVSLLIMVCF